MKKECKPKSKKAGLKEAVMGKPVKSMKKKK